MTWTFLLGAAALVALALILLVPPVIRAGSADQGGRPKGGALVLTTLLVAGSAGLYAWLGTPEGMQPAGPAGSGEPGSMKQAVAQLEERLRERPDNLDGWMLLGRSRMAMGNTNGAIAAYRRARELAPDQPEVLVSLAEALAQSSGHQLAGEPEALLDEALRHDPTHQRALWFAGIADWQAGAYEQAAAHWETLLERLEPGSDVANSVREQLRAAQQEAGIAVAAPAADQADPEQAGGAEVRVSVKVADELAGRFGASDLVFVFARPSSGPGMPLAVKRFPAGRLPVTVTLGPDDAMTPQNALSAEQEIVVTARISKSGSATPQAGDLEGQSEPFIVGEKGRLDLTVDRELGNEE